MKRVAPVCACWRCFVSHAPPFLLPARPRSVLIVTLITQPHQSLQSIIPLSAPHQDYLLTKHPRVCSVEYTNIIPGVLFGGGTDLPQCRVPVVSSYGRYRTVGYRYRVRTEPYTRVFGGYRGRTEPLRYGIYPRYTLTEVSGTGIQVVPNLPKCRVPVLRSYRTYRSVGVPASSSYRTIPECSVGRVLRPYRTLRTQKTSVGYLPSKCPRYTLVRTLPNIPSLEKNNTQNAYQVHIYHMS